MKHKWNSFFSFFFFFLMFSSCVHVFLIWDFINTFNVETKQCLFFVVVVLAISSKLAKFFLMSIFVMNVSNWKNLVTFSFSKLCVNLAFLCVVCDSHVFKETFWKWENQISCWDWEYFYRVFYREWKNSIVVFSLKENSWWFVRSRVQFSSFVDQATSSCAMFQNFWKEKEQFCRAKTTCAFSFWRDR